MCCRPREIILIERNSFLGLNNHLGPCAVEGHSKGKIPILVENRKNLKNFFSFPSANRFVGSKDQKCVLLDQHVTRQIVSASVHEHAKKGRKEVSSSQQCDGDAVIWNVRRPKSSPCSDSLEQELALRPPTSLTVGLSSCHQSQAMELPHFVYMIRHLSLHRT